MLTTLADVPPPSSTNASPLSGRSPSAEETARPPRSRSQPRRGQTRPRERCSPPRANRIASRVLGVRVWIPRRRRRVAGGSSAGWTRRAALSTAANRPALRLGPCLDQHRAFGADALLGTSRAELERRVLHYARSASARRAVGDPLAVARPSGVPMSVTGSSSHGIRRSPRERAYGKTSCPKRAPRREGQLRHDLGSSTYKPH